MLGRLVCGIILGIVCLIVGHDYREICTAKIVTKLNAFGEPRAHKQIRIWRCDLCTHKTEQEILTP